HLDALVPGEYHFRASLTYDGGSTSGADATFTIAGSTPGEAPHGPPASTSTTPHTTNGPARPGARGASFAGAIRIVHGDAVAVPLRCPIDIKPCRGEIVIRALAAPASGARSSGPVPPVYAAGSFAIAPGHRAVIVLALRAGALRRLAHAHLLRARAT